MSDIRVWLWPLAALAVIAGEPLSLQDAIRSAWAKQEGLRAGQALVEKTKAEAEALRSMRLPTLTLGLGFTRTDEPMLAFGTKLDQSRISQMDFLPARLNRPDPVQGTGGTLALNQPFYAGGRLDAARRAGEAMAQSEASNQAHRRQQVAYAVVQAYFGAQVAEQAMKHAEDTLRQAQEMERFVQARVEQGLLLKSEGARTQAYRAQSEAGRAEAQARLASARSGLALLIGVSAEAAELTTPVEDLPVLPEGRGERADLAAARAQFRAAEQGVKAAEGALKPEVGLTLTAGTLRQSWGAGGNWTTASVGAKWTFAASDLRRASAARAQVRAADLMVKWQERVAGREVEEARRAVATAAQKIAFAQAAVEASESVRAIRTARHREGLLPLVEVLDAESGLAGARTLLLSSQLEHRLGQAALALALGQPIENVKE